MSDNKLVKILTDAATITGIAAGYGWIAKKVVKEPMTSSSFSEFDELREIHGGSGSLDRY